MYNKRHMLIVLKLLIFYQKTIVHNIKNKKNKNKNV